MRIFVAGASGVLGRRLVPLLVEDGHEVTAMTRTPEKVELLAELGATPVVCDALDREAVRDAVSTARPEAIVHQLTQIPQAIDPRRYEEQFAVTDRLRTEGTRYLADAGVEAGAQRVVAQSIAFAYLPRNGRVKTEGDPLYVDAPKPLRRSYRAIQALERAVTGTPRIEGVVLRYGFFYGPGTAFAPDGSVAERVRKRGFPVVDGGTGVWSFIHIDDAASATVLALTRGRPGAYNVVDDDPAPVREWLPAYADALGAKQPMRVPKLVARLAGGRYVLYYSLEVRGAANAKAKHELGWEPRRPTWRDGFRETLAARL